MIGYFIPASVLSASGKALLTKKFGSQNHAIILLLFGNVIVSVLCALSCMIGMGLIGVVQKIHQTSAYRHELFSFLVFSWLSFGKVPFL